MIKLWKQLIGHLARRAQADALYSEQLASCSYVVVA